MARGIGGDDGPSLWMLFACVGAWAWLTRTATTVKNSVVDTLEIGKNSAGPLQSESTADITKLEDTVKSWTVSWSTLPHPKTYYQNIADKIYKEICAVSTDEQAIVDWCKPLNKNELMAVAKCFGVKEKAVLGLTTSTFHIFGAFDVAFDGMFKGNERAAIHKIWAVTKLW